MGTLIQFNYEGVIEHQIYNDSIVIGKIPCTIYTIRFQGDYEYHDILVDNNHEQALIGARILFNFNENMGLITQYSIQDFIEIKTLRNNRMKTLDLNEIPEKFHILFNSDWNNGANSSMKMDDRMECQQLYLEFNKWRIQQTISKTLPTKEEDKPVGFIKD